MQRLIIGLLSHRRVNVLEKWLTAFGGKVKRVCIDGWIAARITIWHYFIKFGGDLEPTVNRHAMMLSAKHLCIQRFVYGTR